MKVRIIGPYFGSTGYSVHVRGLASGLLAAGADVRVSSQLPNDYARWCTDAEMKMLTTQPEKDETVIFIGTPPFWRASLSDKPARFIGFLVWEGDRIPKGWLKYVLDERVDQIWVPSQHVFEAVQNTIKEAVKNHVEEIPGAKFESLTNLGKVMIVPHGHDTTVFNCLRGSLAYEDARKKRPFTFLCNKGWVHPTEDRGGVQYTIRAFKEEFREDENVRLLVKVNPAYVQAPDKNAWIQAMLQANGLLGFGPAVNITTDYLDNNGMKAFYGDGDVFVSSNRCEGFNLPGLEAKACGLPTIQTGFGGQTDYMVDGTDWSIPFELAEVKHDLQYEEVSWATPSIPELRRIMRYAFEHQDEVADRGYKAAKEAASWTWADTGRKAMSFLK